MDRRGSKFTVEYLQHLLGIPGNITYVELNHRTNTVEIIFRGNGSCQTAEGMEVVFQTPEKWCQWDEEHEVEQVKSLEEELVEQWESD